MGAAVIAPLNHAEQVEIRQALSPVAWVMVDAIRLERNSPAAATPWIRCRPGQPAGSPGPGGPALTGARRRADSGGRCRALGRLSVVLPRKPVQEDSTRLAVAGIVHGLGIAACRLS